VRSSRPCTGAWYARRRLNHHSETLIALLVCSVAELYPAVRLAQAGEPPVYETVVVAAPTVVEAAREETSGLDLFGKFQETSGEITHALPIARVSLVKQVSPWLSLRANGGRYAHLLSTLATFEGAGYDAHQACVSSWGESHARDRVVMP
jgi:hypothetical protein